jgi:hypothetical protein
VAEAMVVAVVVMVGEAAAEEVEVCRFVIL